MCMHEHMHVYMNVCSGSQLVFFRSSTLCFLLSYIYLENGVIWVMQCMYGDWRTDNLRESVLSFHMWDLGIKLKSPRTAAMPLPAETFHWPHCGFGDKASYWASLIKGRLLAKEPWGCSRLYLPVLELQAQGVTKPTFDVSTED